MDNQKEGLRKLLHERPSFGEFLEEASSAGQDLGAALVEYFDLGSLPLDQRLLLASRLTEIVNGSSSDGLFRRCLEEILSTLSESKSLNRLQAFQEATRVAKTSPVDSALLERYVGL